MNYFYFFVLIVLVFACSSTKQKIEVSANEETFEQDSLSNYVLFEYVNSLTETDYFTLLDSVKAGTSMDFFTLRMAYTKTDDYSPYDSEISELFKNIRTLIDQENFDEALTIIEEIHAFNFVSITSHLFCGYLYKQKNDPIKSAHHYHIYDGLIDSIYESGDGRSPKTAFVVITTKEEYEFLNSFELQVNSQSLINVDDYSFDLMDVTDTQNNEEHEIYFNIELAFSKMAKAFGK